MAIAFTREDGGSVSKLWREVVTASVYAGSKVQDALDSADMITQHYRNRFMPDQDSHLPLLESLKVALMFHPGAIGCRVATRFDNNVQIGTILNYSEECAKQVEGMVEIRWDHCPEDSPVEWVPVSRCTIVDLPDPELLKTLSDTHAKTA